MKNLAVSGNPAYKWSGASGTEFAVPANVQIHYTSEPGAGLAFVTQTLLFTPALARDLAAELLAAAAHAEGQATPAAGGSLQGSQEGITGGGASVGEVHAGDESSTGGAAKLPENRGDLGPDGEVRDGR